jgi:hypothetical protein
MSETSNPRLLTGQVEVLGTTYRITTSKELRVGDEVLVKKPSKRHLLGVVSPTEAKRLTDSQRIANDVTVMTVSSVDRRAKRVHLNGTSEPLHIDRTAPCVVRAVN